MTTDALESRSGKRRSAGSALARLSAENGRSRLALLGEAAALRLGAGRLSFEEYAELGLADNRVYAGADKTAFVGLRQSRAIWLKANYRVDLFALANNKLSADILLATHGLPVLPTLALYRHGVGRPHTFLLRNRDEARRFLMKPDLYPLFSKPLNGFQSLGAFSVERYDAASDLLVATAGSPLPLETFLGYLEAHGADGYLFQRRQDPHPAIRRICGDRLATVRLLTIVTDGKPLLLRACWKIPASQNAADNFWRPGNILATLDLETGQVTRAVRKAGPGYAEVVRHPETQAKILGAAVPNWAEVKALALDGARVLPDLPLIGWDIAPVEGGAVIVEPNATPDFNLHQLADRRGMLDERFSRFLAERVRHAKDARRAARKSAAKGHASGTALPDVHR